MPTRPKSSKPNKQPVEYEVLKILDLIDRSHCEKMAEGTDAAAICVKRVITAADPDAEFQRIVKGFLASEIEYERRAKIHRLSVFFGVSAENMKRYLKAKGRTNQSD
jgi:hypothetical protein